MKSSKGDKLFIILNYTLLGLLALICVYPFIYIISASLSSGKAVTEGGVWLWPVDINFESYKQVFSESAIWKAFGNTIFYTVVGTAVNLLLTICGAYPLSKKDLKGRSFLAFFIAFTMWFNAGMVPMYLNFSSLHLLDTRTAIIIGFGITTFLVFILRTFFQSLPDSLEESAKIDGANDWQILWKIVLPLSKPALITVGLFYAVARWNGYFWAMVILKDPDKIPLQVLLQKLIVQMDIEEQFTIINAGMYSQETLIYATIVVSALPVLALYPFLQRYFKKGAVIGAIKE
ncbi:carbohydrate ABC transporter permease [Oceanobacillus arenosus]|uniref:Carbohydrate ABC transporter permease n=1 Tax=Oceanobacillus arenosus TaxID=1229153 RepID=A0A3D8Q143_9BACI|nr:carbohydrate ABC transporter permease [Oceanobacillus arenosus]RDW21318.1 carbohydrate ABC transporter permease [Oceanobacillus arenosus]